MLVVADQGARRVGRQRRLAGARQAEEHRGVAVRSFIRRTVHRHDATGRQQIIERREHRLLHFAGIGRAADQHDHPRQVDGDDGFGGSAMPRRIGAEGRQVDDRHLRHEAWKIRGSRPDQQVADEQRVPGIFGDDAGLQAVCRVGAADEILHEQVAVCRMRQEIRVQPLESLRRHRLVVVPPHRRRGVFVADDELVLGRAAGVAARIGDQGAVGGESRLAPGDRFLVEFGRRKIIAHRARRPQTDPVNPKCWVANSDCCHLIPSAVDGPALPDGTLSKRAIRSKQKSQMISNH